MRYISTRGNAHSRSFREILLSGLAEDGGLFVPETLPHFSAEEIASFATLSYPELAFRILAPFIGDEIEPAVLNRLIHKAYASFHHPKIAPLTRLNEQEYLLELFHGPTLAFKDFALQLLGALLGHVLEEENKRVTIIGATSGDTGSAAIMGCYQSPRVEMFILHPKGKVSEAQRRQMTTILAPNVHNLAIEGTFDECQDIVKALFLNPPKGLESAPLSAVNSINWVRIMAQTVYYFYAAAQLKTPMSFCVPTGNFGDVYAGYIAHRMGLPITRLIVATNENDIMHRFFTNNAYAREAMRMTLAPSMDIQVASNFERLLFDLHDRNGAEIRALMQGFAERGTLTLDTARHKALQNFWSSARASDADIVNITQHIHAQTQHTIDPHTATGIYAARHIPREANETRIILATAHPAKFPDALLRAGLTPAPLPDFLTDLLTRKERYITLPASLEAVATEITQRKRQHT